MDKEKRIRILQQISTIVGTCWVFLGLIAGILFPMIYMVPLLYSSWALFASIGHNSWANSYLRIDYNDPRFISHYMLLKQQFFFWDLLSLFLDYPIW